MCLSVPRKANLPTTVPLTDIGLVDNWLYGSNVRFVKGLRLYEMLVSISHKAAPYNSKFWVTMTNFPELVVRGCLRQFVGVCSCMGLPYGYYLH